MASSRRATAVKSAGGSTDLDRARAAWDAGEYSRVVDFVASATLERREDRISAAVLGARALLRLDRADEVAASLARAKNEAKGAEETALVQMLLGAALTRTSHRERGERVLDEALAMASGNATALVAEIEYYRALSRWSSHRLDEAETIIESGLSRATGVVAALLLQLLGWIDVRRENYTAAAHQFAAALEALDKARHNDLKLRARILNALGIIAAETIDLRLGRLVRRNYGNMEWTEDTRIEHFFVLEYLSWLSLLEGEIARAWDERQLALTLTLESGHHASALIGAAQLANVVGDRYSASRYLALAGSLLLRGDQVDLDVDRRLAMLSFVIAAANSDAGEKVMALYDRTRARRTEMLSYEDDRRLEAFELYARGKLAVAEQRISNAIADLERSLDLWTRLTHRLRAALVADDLRSATGERRWAQISLDALRNAPNAWLRSSLERRSHEDDPLGKLTAAERRVLAELCKGKRSRDIAKAFGRSFNTINNHTRKVFSAFGVQNRAALVAECARLGLLDDQSALH